jgi:hypothetical protein
MEKKQRASGVSVGIKETLVSMEKGCQLIDFPKPAEFIVKIANTLEEREAVFKLGYQVYLKKGFINANPQEWLIRNYDSSSETVILIVQDKDKNLAGSVTLVFDGDCVLPAEKIYGDEIMALKARGNRIVEISRLMVSPEYRNSKEILLLLFNYLAIYSHHIKHYTCLTIQVNPRHKTYYKALLSFDEIGNEKISPHLKNAPAILLHLPLSRYQAEARRHATQSEKNHKERSLYPYSLKAEQENLVAYYLEKQAKPISLEEKLYFGFSQSGVCQAVGV